MSFRPIGILVMTILLKVSEGESVLAWAAYVGNY